MVKGAWSWQNKQMFDFMKLSEYQYYSISKTENEFNIY